MSLRKLDKSVAGKLERDIKILQFGEGNFLRAFVDYMVDIANETGDFNGDVVIIKPTNRGNLDLFREQECQFTVSLRGIIDNEAQMINRTITCVTEAFESYSEYDKYMECAHIESLRYVVSNTTEAGITFDSSDSINMHPPKTFPGKLTQFLFERYKYFDGAVNKGLVMLPVELINNNGECLKNCIMKYIEIWKLEDDFTKWINNSCIFASTLVDRIVSGYPASEEEEIWEDVGYIDNLITAAEPYGLWVIEAPARLADEFTLSRAGMPVMFTNNLEQYKRRKVRILNGAHTSFVLASYLCGNDYVSQSMKDEIIYKFMRCTIYNEIIPTLDMSKEELTGFAEDVITRFNNPYVKHELLSISLNSVSKWKTRCMPSLIEYVDIKGNVPPHLTFSLAALMQFYTGDFVDNNHMTGYRGTETYNINDDLNVLEFFQSKCKMSDEEYTNAVLSNKMIWGVDLTKIIGFETAVRGYITDIREFGMRKAIIMNFND